MELYKQFAFDCVYTCLYNMLSDDINMFKLTNAKYIVNNYPITKSKEVYLARISKLIQWRVSTDPFHRFTIRTD